jgi:hypothetical protein
MSKEAVKLFHANPIRIAPCFGGQKRRINADMAGYQVIDAQDVVKMETGALEVSGKKIPRWSKRSKRSSMSKPMASFRPARLGLS